MHAGGTRRVAHPICRAADQFGRSPSDFPQRGPAEPTFLGQYSEGRPRSSDRLLRTFAIADGAIRQTSRTSSLSCAHKLHTRPRNLLKVKIFRPVPSSAPRKIFYLRDSICLPVKSIACKRRSLFSCAHKIARFGPSANCPCTRSAHECHRVAAGSDASNRMRAGCSCAITPCAPSSRTARSPRA